MRRVTTYEWSIALRTDDEVSSARESHSHLMRGRTWDLVEEAAE